MDEDNEISSSRNLPIVSEYISVKDAAKILGVADQRVYLYIEQGRIQAKKLSNFTVIPISEVEKFRRKPPGRTRKKPPIWHIPSPYSAFYSTSIKVKIVSGMQNTLLARFEQIRASEEYNFPGTVARYIIGREQIPEQLEILLIWKQSIMPNEDERERSLEAFRYILSDVLDWSSAQYSHDKVYMHA